MHPCWVYRVVPKAVGVVPVETTMVCDPKLSAQAFLKQVQSFGHGFRTINDIQQAVETDTSAYCFKHNQTCKVDTEPPTFLVGGFPCAPFSIQRNGRHQRGRCLRRNASFRNTPDLPPFSKTHFSSRRKDHIPGGLDLRPLV